MIVYILFAASVAMAYFWHHEEGYRLLAILTVFLAAFMFAVLISG